MDTILKVNRVVSLVGYWIFGLNCKKALTLTTESLNLIFSPLVEEGMFDMF